ncbi:hypothetical protein [Parvibium lacunae]|uniref:Uncharacterized protein n=1 Tax=Parvibium lacunae TaxID=1888893 RepID=A0A368L4R1_9BURK|nr:hypothetical protein [Parvibium lacunae]RCS58557.1 hypothetical protein DU000_07050 [Parvibium lacunae]
MNRKTERIWHRADGSVIACTEKIKVLNDNLAELRQLAQDALDDALLLEGTEAEVKAAFIETIENLIASYPERQ